MKLRMALVATITLLFVLGGIFIFWETTLISGTSLPAMLLCIAGAVGGIVGGVWLFLSLKLKQDGKTP